MSNIVANIEKINQELGQVKLIVVTKTRNLNEIMEVYNTGERRFGENRVQELVQKQIDLPKDIEWHLIGHLQTNKVKYIAPFVNTIHSVDSLKLLETINKEAAKHNRTIKCLIQCYVAQEETKFGLTLPEVYTLLSEPKLAEFTHVNICGIMGMATNTNNKEQISNEFKTLNNWFNNIKKDFFSTRSSFNELSMGMSSDYSIAIKHGSTMVRVGSLVFN